MVEGQHVLAAEIIEELQAISDDLAMTPDSITDGD